MVVDLRNKLSINKESKEKYFLLHQQPCGFFQHQIFLKKDGEKIWKYVRSKNQRLYLEYSINPDWSRISLVVDNTETVGIISFEYLTRILPGSLLLHNILTFHGVLMEYQGQGIIISAPSGTGKTTHARMWRDRYHSLIINGDRATVQRQDGIWTGFGLPWSGTSGEQINRSVPLKALVVLERGEKNDAHQITGLEAFGAVWPHLLYPGWDREMTGRAMDQLDIFLREIPIIRFSCRPDPESVDVLYHEIFR